jgi:hypothetical protein
MIGLEAHIETPLEELTYEELDELGREITRAITEAYQASDDELVVRLLREKDAINRMKAVSAL